MADAIAGELAFKTEQMINTGDPSWIRDCFHVPQTIETSSGKRVLHTEECVTRLFHDVRNYYFERGVTDVARSVQSAEPIDDNTIGSILVTRLFRKGWEPYRKPFPIYSVIRRLDGHWKIAGTVYAILDSTSHNEALVADWDHIIEQID